MRPLETLARLRGFELPRLIAFNEGRGGLPRTNVTTEWSTAEIYMHGAQVTGFQKNGEPPVLFLGQMSTFADGKAIRGGVPICFPWFGPRPDDVAHGYARITDWELCGAAATPKGGATLRFKLPEVVTREREAPLGVEFVVTITDRLAMELIVSNRSAERRLEFENCLHTYFAVGDVGEISITGLESAQYLDQTADDVLRTESDQPIRIRSQIDRTYLDAVSTVEIHDPIFGRKIRVEKSGARSTVVWNPWTTQILRDLGPEEYRRMICVESGNVGRNRVTVDPGKIARMEVILSTEQRP